jgi:hypothetical protein
MKRLIALLLLLGLLLSCGGCSATSGGENTYTLYLRQTDTVTGSAYFTEEIQLAQQEDERSLVRSLVEALLTGTNLVGEGALFPSGIKLRSCVLSGGVVTIDLSEELGQMDGIDLTTAAYGVVLTLTQLPDVTGVRLLMEGEELPNGPTGVLTQGQMVLSGAMEDPVSLSVVLYYPDDQGGMASEYRVLTVYGGDTSVQCQAVLSALSSRDQGEPFPQEPLTQDAISVSGGVCHLTLPESWTVFLLERDSLWQNCLAASLCQLDGVNCVQLHTMTDSALSGRVLQPNK